jgi:uncharacterized protein (DUF111 family)
MNTLYLDIFSGISGDMFVGALLDLGADLKELESQLRSLKVEGVPRPREARPEGRHRRREV